MPSVGDADLGVFSGTGGRGVCIVLFSLKQVYILAFSGFLHGNSSLWSIVVHYIFIHTGIVQAKVCLRYDEVLVHAIPHLLRDGTFDGVDVAPCHLGEVLERGQERRQVPRRGLRVQRDPHVPPSPPH